MLDPKLKDLLQDLLFARGPCGQEDEVRLVCEQWLTSAGFEHSHDAAGNLVCLLASAGGDDADAVRVFVHLDEISFLIKKILADGTVKLGALGSFSPAFLGQMQKM